MRLCAHLSFASVVGFGSNATEFYTTKSQWHEGLDPMLDGSDSTELFDSFAQPERC